MKKLLSVLLAACSTAGALAQYKVIDLTPPATDSEVIAGLDAFAVGGQNRGGVQVGFGTNASGSADVFWHAVMWQGTNPSMIQLWDPLNFSQAEGTDGFQEVGFTGNSIINAALWSGSAASYVNLNPLGFQESEALGVSSGVQAGWGFTNPISFGDDSRFTIIQGGRHALAWSGTAASAVDLNPVGFDASSANGIENGLEVGGAVRSSDGVTRALQWNGAPNSYVDISPVTEWANNPTVASRIHKGQTVGYFYTAGQSHAALWNGSSNSTMVDLHPAGYFDSVAIDTNGTNQVGYGDVGVGLLFGRIRRHALLWSGTANNVIDLHQFLPQGYEYSAANSIGDDGSILVTAQQWQPGGIPNTDALSTVGGRTITHAYLLVPTSDTPVCAVQSVSVDQSIVPMGLTGETIPIFSTPVNGTVTLTSPAPPGGAVVRLLNPAIDGTNPFVAGGYETSVTVPEGATSATFLASDPLLVLASALSVEQPITASYGGITAETHYNTIGVDPSWVGGSPVRQGLVGQIQLATPVNADELVPLTSSDPTILQVPPYVLLHKGMAFTSYYYSITPDLQSEIVTVSGTCSRGAFSGQIGVGAFSRPVAALASFTPTSALAGQAFTMTLTGNIFSSSAQVIVNGTPVPTTFVSSTQLIASVPAGVTPDATQYVVSVTNPKAFTSNLLLLTTTAPTLSAVNPSSVLAGSNASVTLTGSNFVSGAQLFLGTGSTGLSTAFVSAKQLTATIPANLIPVAGTVQAFILNPNSIAKSTAVTLNIANPKPIIGGLSPSNVAIGTPGVTVTINGTGFVPTSQVSLSGKAATMTYISPTQVQVTIPAATLAKKATLSVNIQNPTPGGGGSNGVNLTVS